MASMRPISSGSPSRYWPWVLRPRSIPQDHVLDEVDQLHLDADAHLALEHIHLAKLVRPKERRRQVVTHDPSPNHGIRCVFPRVVDP
jgi:hypothetical protein